MGPYLIRILVWTWMLAPLCPAPPAQDPTKTAAITIEVKDESGGTIPNAQVQITPSPSDIGKSLTTDWQGRLQVGVPPGGYDISVTSAGFARMKKRVEVQDTTAQLVSVVLRPGSCSGGGCFQREEIPLHEPSRAVSPDQRYAIIENDDIMDRYAYFLDDRHLNSRRELFTYNKPLFFLWNPDSKVFAVTGYTGSDVSRSTVVAVDEIVRPIPVLDLFARQLSEIEREDLEGRLTSEHTKIVAIAWVKPADLEVEVSSYDDKSHAGFMQTYTLPVDLHPAATAPIWPK